MATLSKDAEKLMLTTLQQHDTYFSEVFSKTTVEKMKENISNDFDILFGTDVFVLSKEQIEVIRKALVNYTSDNDVQEVRNLLNKFS